MLQIDTVLSSMWPLKVPEERPFWVSNFPFWDLFGLGNVASIFGGALILGICIGVQNNLKIGEVPRGNPDVIFWGFIFGPGIFLSFV